MLKGRSNISVVLITTLVNLPEAWNYSSKGLAEPSQGLLTVERPLKTFLSATVLCVREVRRGPAEDWTLESIYEAQSAERKGQWR